MRCMIRIVFTGFETLPTIDISFIQPFARTQSGANDQMTYQA